MKKAILFSILLIPFLSNGQKFKRNEIGLGIGYCQLYPIKDFKLDYIQYIFSKKQLAENIGSRRNNVKGFISPTLYYTFYPYNDFSFRTSFRYMNIQSIETERMYDLGPSDALEELKYHLKTVESSLGFSFRILNKKYFEFYTGLDVEYVYSKFSVLDRYNKLRFDLNNYGFLKYYLGYNQRLDEHFNIKFEASILADEEYVIRPINRLSLNYQF